jgi:hypothetical protein
VNKKARWTAVVLIAIFLIGLLLQLIRVGILYSDQGSIGLAVLIGLVALMTLAGYLSVRPGIKRSREFRAHYDHISDELGADISIPVWLYDGAEPLRAFARDADAMPTRVIVSADEIGLRFTAEWDEALAQVPWKEIQDFSVESRFATRSVPVQIIVMSLHSGTETLSLYPGAPRGKGIGWMRGDVLTGTVRELQQVRIAHVNSAH